MRRRGAVALAQHHSDGRSTGVDQRGTVPLQLLDLEAIGADQCGWSFVLDPKGAVRLVQAVHDRSRGRVDTSQVLKEADERPVVLKR